MARFRRRTDHNQAQIMKDLRRCGLSVVDISMVGGGCPDLLVGYGGSINFLVEVKNPDGRGDRFTPAEVKFMEDWRGIPVIVAHTAEDVLKRL